MLFNRHSELEGRHAFLSPSYYHWLNYDHQKLEARFHTVSAARRGTDMHKLAQDAIRLRVFIHESNDAFADYVNDCISWGMSPEVPLFYSENCFGTPDAMKYEEAPPELDGASLLLISDLKTGTTAAKFKQLEVYAALFFLEYGFSPLETLIQLRIYQVDDVRLFEPSGEDILAIMDTIIEFDAKIEEFKEANL